MAWPDSGKSLAPLAAWFDGAKRTLPWRAADLRTPHSDPYAVLVSELMLQQTQVATVIPYFERWMARFPNPATLAAASSGDVHKAWEGLGYYRRARHLQEASRRIASDGWPDTLEGLLTLPGLGPYTAAAVASLAFQWPEPALDGNAFRVLARILGLEGDPAREAAALRAWLKPALVLLGPSRLTQALMELGALVCSPAPRCEACPLAEGCAARGMDATSRIPARKARPKQKEEKLWLLAVHSKGRWLLKPPAGRGLLAGLWSWPTLPVGPEPNAPVGEVPAPYGLRGWGTWPAWTQVYTHRKEQVRPVRLECAARFEAAGLVWVTEAELPALPMGKRDLRLKGFLETEPETKAAPPVAELLKGLRG